MGYREPKGKGHDDHIDHDYEPEREPPCEELALIHQEEVAYERYLDSMGGGRR